MLDFIYQNKTELIFGKHDESVIADRIKQLASKHVFIVYGMNSVVRSGLLKRITDALSNTKIAYTEYGGVSANPLRTHADEGIKLARANKADFVLAVGGGSVIDAAKYIAMGIVDDNAWSNLVNATTGKPHGKITALPVGAVLTIPAAGSESSTACVIKCETDDTKYSIGSNAIRPVFAFINPEWCFTLPKPQISYGASDIFAHMLERYMSPQDNVTLTDELLEGAMRAMLKIAPLTYNDNTSYQYWSEFCLLGTIAHNGMLCMGRPMQDWGTHRIENRLLSGAHDIAHGAGLAIIFPAWLKHMATKRPAKIQQFATRVMGQPTTQKGIAAFENWLTSLDLPTRLSHINLDPATVSAKARTEFPPDLIMGAYAELTLDEILAVIKLAA